MNPQYILQKIPNRFRRPNGFPKYIGSAQICLDKMKKYKQKYFGINIEIKIMLKKQYLNGFQGIYPVYKQRYIIHLQNNDSFQLIYIQQNGTIINNVKGQNGAKFHMFSDGEVFLQQQKQNNVCIKLWNLKTYTFEILQQFTFGSNYFYSVFPKKRRILIANCNFLSQLQYQFYFVGYDNKINLIKAGKQRYPNLDLNNALQINNGRGLAICSLDQNNKKQIVIIDIDRIQMYSIPDVYGKQKQYKINKIVELAKGVFYFEYRPKIKSQKLKPKQQFLFYCDSQTLFSDFPLNNRMARYGFYQFKNKPFKIPEQKQIYIYKYKNEDWVQQKFGFMLKQLCYHLHLKQSNIWIDFKNLQFLGADHKISKSYQGLSFQNYPLETSKYDPTFFTQLKFKRYIKLQEIEQFKRFAEIQLKFYQFVNSGIVYTFFLNQHIMKVDDDIVYEVNKLLDSLLNGMILFAYFYYQFNNFSNFNNLKYKGQVTIPIFLHSQLNQSNNIFFQQSLFILF